MPETSLEKTLLLLGQNLKEILVAVFEPFREKKFPINVVMYNKGIGYFLGNSGRFRN
jgi:hypothetical protein